MVPEPHSATPIACISLHKNQNETQRERERERERPPTTMQRVDELVKAFVSMTTKGASGMTTLCWSKSVFSMAEEVAKQLVIIGPEALLFGVLKCFLGGTGGMGSAAIFILKVIINSRP
ncbi:hypothetical protein EUGRSUZ_E02222 [Eucalyptus grandis]|uniref:Uncharacterized protein n=2 Tax=Eucalyptus grandis TaxID=71139 RepID=A0ACC3KXM3_EUCGR|nr:hypothetical protein EUGRSUZ_E02222 [Eucalyptus grandis]